MNHETLARLQDQFGSADTSTAAFHAVVAMLDESDAEMARLTLALAAQRRVTKEQVEAVIVAIRNVDCDRKTRGSGYPEMAEAAVKALGLELPEGT